ncbi:hypothetical protein EC957_011192 [Mortierella hygrophila]|uniref:Mitochondrial adapter protein MCP1 transmembrane domain-containing protein n=1 Tax=Mortierella hygrophila TaxID=979708 RepID=A0A9P6F9T5_9FUNG|nr:hypothetical protein EC957_011192 [Mortierella hygrophila]
MASATPLEPYNVWEDVPSTMDINPSSIETDDNDSTITTTSNYSNNSKSSKSSSGGSPTRYSAQTIRQKKGRQLLSTMMGAEEDKDGNSSVSGGGLFPTVGTSSSTVTVEETKEREDEGGSKKKTMTTTTRTATTSSSSGKPSTSTSNPAAAGGANSHADGAGASAEGQVGLGKAPLPLGGGGRGGFPSVGLYQGIGRVQAFSAMAFSTFAVIHLVPPMLASVGGIELANKALLWGRVYYQTNGLEQVLVSGSLLVHLGAGLCKAVIRMVWKVKSYYSGSSSSTSPRAAIEERDTPTVNKESSTMTNASGSTTTTTKITTITKTTGGGSGSGSASAPGLFPYHRLAGWILTPMVIAHMNDMRLAPLEVLGDSSMVDYSFVTYLHRVGRSGPYILLVGLLAYHMFGGGPVAFNMVLPKGSARRVKVQDLVRSKKVRGVFAAVVVGVVVVGTARIMFAEGPIPLSRVYLSLLDL